MQDVDGPAHVQVLTQPTGCRRPRVEAKPLRDVSRSHSLNGIGGHGSRRRDLGQKLPVRAAESELAVGSSIHLIALFVDRAMVPAAE